MSTTSATPQPMKRFLRNTLTDSHISMYIQYRLYFFYSHLIMVSQYYDGVRCVFFSVWPNILRETRLLKSNWYCLRLRSIKTINTAWLVSERHRGQFKNARTDDNVTNLRNTRALSGHDVLWGTERNISPAKRVLCVCVFCNLTVITCTIAITIDIIGPDAKK